MTIEDSALSFPSLLESVHFFTAYYQKQYIQFSKNVNSLDHLFEERDLKATIQFMPENSDSLRLIFNGMGLSLDKIRKAGVVNFDQLMRQHKGGATLNFNMLSNHSNRLYHFNRYLESIFDGYVHTNFYGTPMNSRGFRPHSDSHDVFIFQVRGSKDWAFYKTKNKAIKIRKAYNIDEIEPIAETRMNEGDLMYVPRGLLHAAKATHEISWHLTIGITGYYWSDLISEMIEQNVPTHEKLKNVVPKGASKEAIKSEINHMFKNTNFELSVEEGWEKFNMRFPNLGKYLDDIEIPDLNQLQNLNDEMSFKLKKDKLNIAFETDHISLNLPYREIPLKLHTRLKEIISQMTTAVSFTSKQLIGLEDEEEKLLLVYYLWNNGMIEPNLN